MTEMIEILLAPMVACIILAGIHCYLGVHVLMREVVFVDLALAQVAALGAAASVLFGLSADSGAAYLCSLGFTLAGALVFAVSRFRDRRVPQEAVIGIVFAASSAVAVLILSKTALEREQIENMLVGRLLFVGWPEVGKTAAIYSAVAGLHGLCRRPFFAISAGDPAFMAGRRRVVLWDFLFYGTFGIVVTSSVRMAGVLLVFSFLIVPASCAMLFLTGTRGRLIAGWCFGLLASAGGLTASAVWDLPTGASVVAAFAAIFLLAALAHTLIDRATARRT